MLSLFTLVLVASLSGMFTSPGSAAPPAVVVLSFDGFKPEYLTAENMPKTTELKEKAAGPTFVRSVFPTKTFVTHFTLSTGVYPNVHGVYGNKIFNDKGEEIFNTKEQFQSNDKITPIWIENQNAGRHSGVMMWPGSEFEYNGKTPTYIEEYDPEITWENRVDKIVQWMSDKEKRANLVMAYFEDTPSYDVAQRQNEISGQIKKVDDTIHAIYSKLEAANIDGNVDMVIISDHGTKQVTGSNVLIIEDIVASTGVQTIVSGPIVFVRSDDESKSDNVYTELTSKDGNGTKFNVYSQDKLPSEWNINGISSLKSVNILVAEPGYTFYEREAFAKAKGSLEANSFVVEENGYDNKEPSMNAFFLGIGLKFKDNFFPENSSFDLIDVYPLLKKLLDLTTAANDVQTNIELSSKVKELLED